MKGLDLIILQHLYNKGTESAGQKDVEPDIVPVNEPAKDVRVFLPRLEYGENNLRLYGRDHWSITAWRICQPIDVGRKRSQIHSVEDCDACSIEAFAIRRLAIDKGFEISARFIE